MMKDHALFNEYMLAYRLKMKHSELITMPNVEYLRWQAFVKRCNAEGIPL